MIEKHTRLFLLLQQIEALKIEIDNGNVELIENWLAINEEVDEMIALIMDVHPEFNSIGDNIVRYAFKLVSQTL